MPSSSKKSKGKAKAQPDPVPSSSAYVPSTATDAQEDQLLFDDEPATTGDQPAENTGKDNADGKLICVQCALDGVADTCERRRKTARCIRCNASNKDCSLRVGKL